MAKAAPETRLRSSKQLRLWLWAPLMVGVPAASTALAIDEPATVWHMACPKTDGPQTDDPSACFVEQFAIAQPMNVPVLHVTFHLDGKDGMARIVLTTPLAVWLPAGVRLTLDQSPPVDLPFERCGVGGCIASALLDQGALEKFENGKTLVVGFTDTTSRDIPIRLEGLTEALTSLPR